MTNSRYWLTAATSRRYTKTEKGLAMENLPHGRRLARQRRVVERARHNARNPHLPAYSRRYHVNRNGGVPRMRSYRSPQAGAPIAPPTLSSGYSMATFVPILPGH